MRITETTIYLADNGAAYCGEHLGSSARHTGYDISGQEILEITPDLAAEFKTMAGRVPSCEIPTCGRKASLLHA